MTHALAAVGCAVSVLHVNHGLRECADLDEDCARELADVLGVEFVVERVDVEHGPNLEARARDARHAAFHRARRAGGVVALAHTADDQAETVILRLIRGTGPDGMAAMLAPSEGIIRPVLNERRETLRRYCEERRLRFRDDPMNDELRFQRVRIRKEVLPLLDEIAQRDVVPLLTRFAEVSAEQRAAMSELLAHVPRSLNEPFPLGGIGELSNPALAELLRAWWGLPSLDRASLGRVMNVARGVVLATETSGGERVERHDGSLVRLPHGDSPDR